MLMEQEGLAVAVELTPKWYKMAAMAEASPHVTLAIQANHQVKELHPMTKQSHSSVEWSQPEALECRQLTDPLFCIILNQPQ